MESEGAQTDQERQRGKRSVSVHCTSRSMPIYGIHTQLTVDFNRGNPMNDSHHNQHKCRQQLLHIQQQTETVWTLQVMQFQLAKEYYHNTYNPFAVCVCELCRTVTEC